ncbi:MAG: DUF1552 domain-containing protein [Myxococcales bacterium]|nr:DUF1552 domain-containing protein [Myxococcales bacterium]
MIMRFRDLIDRRRAGTKLSGRDLSRRAFLGGAGALLTIPVFESLVGEKAAHADDSFPARMLAYYVPNGIVMDNWTPAQTGSGYTITPILSPLEALQDKVLILSGLSNSPAKPDGPGDHAGGTSGFLTAAHANKSETDISLGISMDQVIANAIGDQTRIASMQIGIDGGGSTGGCDSGYSCAYTRNISWASATQPLPKTTSPLVVFNQIFEGADPTDSAAEQAKRKLYRLSVLDYVREEANKLSAKLDYKDRAKLDEYLSGIRDLEDRINKPAPTCDAIPEPTDGPAFLEHVDIMQDLMVLAMRCDTTRVISFMLANAGSNRTYGFIGVDGAHHGLSHHGGDPQNLADLTIIDTWEVSKYAELLTKMDAVVEGTGTLLEHSQVFFSSEIEDGNAHRHRNLPVILGGSCHGYYATGRHIEYEADKSKDGPPIANLFLSMMEAMGVDEASFGNSTGKLGQLST